MNIWTKSLRKSLATFVLWGVITMVHGNDVLPKYAIMQSIGIGNNGEGIVSEIEFHYGASDLIGGPAHRVFAPKRGLYYSQSIASPIPEVAQVHWLSSRGNSHNETLPIAALIKNISRFYGFNFAFIDDRIEVYLIEKIPTPGPYLNLQDIKVYVSGAGGEAPNGR